MGQPFSYIVIGRSGAKLTLSPLYNGITYPLEIIFLILWATAIVTNSAFTGRFLPNECILVGISLYLGTINVLYLQADEVCIHQHLNYLGKDIVNIACETIFTKEVDGIVVRTLHAAEPHEVDISFEELLHLST